ncbi:MAG: GlmU family protein [Saprospiraceae bacterium]|nr:GlmU family protein [Saprospiraceae bacterium]
MKNIILFDNEIRDRLLPLTYLRPVSELRIGILTIREKWERQLGGTVSYITRDYLAEKYPIDYGTENYLINASALPSDQLCRLINQMDFNEAFLNGEELIAAKLSEQQFERLINDEDFNELNGVDLAGTDYIKIDHIWDIFRYNEKAIQEDFNLLTRGRKSQPLSDTNQVIGKENIFVEEGASVECAILNASTGPIYIGKNATIMEGCMLRGPIALCEKSVLKMGAKIYGGTTIGPVSKIGGEVQGTVIQGYSNKGHDGYLGNSLVGEWCNIGAGANNSNLKNNYDEVKLWSYIDERFVKSGQQFLGMILGDHSKLAISTTINTGTVIGVSCNIFGSGFPRNFIPSFSWGGAQGFTTYKTDKAFDTVDRVYARRKKNFEVEDRLILLRVFEDTAKYRRWEKKD